MFGVGLNYLLSSSFVDSSKWEEELWSDISHLLFDFDIDNSVSLFPLSYCFFFASKTRSGRFGFFRKIWFDHWPARKFPHSQCKKRSRIQCEQNLIGTNSSLSGAWPLNAPGWVGGTVTRLGVLKSKDFYFSIQIVCRFSILKPSYQKCYVEFRVAVKYCFDGSKSTSIFCHLLVDILWRSISRVDKKLAPRCRRSFANFELLLSITIGYTSISQPSSVLKWLINDNNRRHGASLAQHLPSAPAQSGSTIFFTNWLRVNH